MQTWSRTTTTNNLWNAPWIVRRCISHNAEQYASHLAAQNAPAVTFESLGIRPAIANAVRTAFPNVTHPTETQRKFIPAVLNGSDVLLKDNTGSGKTFGVTMALLSKPRIRLKRHDASDKPEETSCITSLVIVPHKDLAYQIMHWIQRLVSASTGSSPPPPISSIAQVLVRDKMSHVTTGLSTLRREAPHILIGTPGALMDVFGEDRNALRLQSLSTVMVDEVDYLIQSVPRKHSKKMWDKAKTKIDRHPSVTKQLLDVIYAERIRENERARLDPEASMPAHPSRPSNRSPQLIMSSATLRNHLRMHLYTESGWLRREGIEKVKGSSEPAAFLLDRSKETRELNESDREVYNVLGSTALSHHVLVVDEDGKVANVEGAVHNPSVPPPETSLTDGAAPVEDHGSQASSPDFASDADRKTIEKYSSTASPFNPDLLEAVATSFALDVPSLALFVLPSSASVHRAVFDLRELGVNAHALDLLAATSGRSHLLQGGSTVKEDPTLLVSTLATTRGLDLPEMTHVFILGVPESGKVDGRTIDAYLHIAGRVGRFGRGGKIITVVEGRSRDKDDLTELELEGGMGARKDGGDVAKMKRILDEIWVTPSRLEHFD